MAIKAIWAQTLEGGIGKDNRLPFKNKDDLRHFKSTTIFNIVVMGWNTFESLGCNPLPERINLVLTHKDIEVEGVTIVHSVREVLDFYEADNTHDLFVLGGAKVYKAFAPYYHELIVSYIKGSYECDTFSPLTDMVRKAKEIHCIEYDNVTIKEYKVGV